MIELDYWLDGIVSTCDLIAEDGLFERIWLGGDTTITSITYPDELFEQIFGDLDAENYLDMLSSEKKINFSYLSLIKKFLFSLKKFEALCDGSKDDFDLVLLLNSSEWRAVKTDATEVVNYSRLK